MARTVYILNTTTSNRVGMVTLGFPFERGEATSTSQRIVVEGATSYVQKVQWQPFGANYIDGTNGNFHSYRYAKICFRADVNASTEKSAEVHIGDIAYTPIPYSSTVLNAFVGINIEFRINGQTIVIPLSNLTLLQTADTDDHIRRFKYWGRPFPTMPWIWVELITDVPSLSQANATGLVVNTSPVEVAQFWFRYGNSYAARNLGRAAGPFTAQTRNFYLNEPISLSIIGCDSGLRFENHVYSINNVGNGKKYILEDPAFNFFNGQSLNNNNCMKYSNCRVYRGFLVLGNNSTSSVVAERQRAMTAMASGWNKFMPPSFSDIALPPNVPNDRENQKAKIDTMMTDILARQNPLPFPAGVYSLKPSSSGGGDQGAYGGAFHHHPLYYTMKAAYAAEIPFILHGMDSHGYRPMWMYEADGTRWKYQNYPRANIWWCEPHKDGRDLCGVHIEAPSAPSAKASTPYEEYQGPDRQHCSIQLDATAAIFTADYFALEFCEIAAELYSASGSTDTDSPTINGWEADRASGRLLQSLVSLFFATGNMTAFKGLATRAWLGYVINESWRFGDYASGIEQLKFIDAVGVFSNWSSCDYSRWNVVHNYPNLIPAAGTLFNLFPKETPHITPWQLSFAAIALYQVSIAIKQMYTVPVFLVKPVVSSNFITDGVIQFTEPADQNIRLIVRSDIFRTLSRDLAGSVLQHNTFKLGPGSEQSWYNIAVRITARPGLLSTTAARAIECFPVGATITGLTSGTVAQVISLEGGIGDQQGNGTLPRFVNLFLKVLSGPGFTANGSVLRENVLSSTGYNTAEATPDPSQGTGFANNKWAGSSSSCMDRNGSSHGLPGTGANFRKALTNAQMEETDRRRIWNVHTNGGPNWCQIVRDYGEWQTAVTPIVLGGLNDGYYWSNSTIYTTARLRSKVQAVLNDSLALAGQATSIWDMKIWPYMGYVFNFMNTDSPVLTPSVVSAIATVPNAVTQAEVIRVITLEPELVTGQGLIPTPTVFATAPISADVSIKPVAVTNRKPNLVEPPRVFTGSDKSADVSSGAGSVPNVTPVVTTVDVGPRRSVVIDLSMDGPSESSRNRNLTIDSVYIAPSGPGIRGFTVATAELDYMTPYYPPQDPRDTPYDPATTSPIDLSLVPTTYNYRSL